MKTVFHDGFTMDEIKAAQINIYVKSGNGYTICERVAGSDKTRN